MSVVPYKKKDTALEVLLGSLDSMSSRVAYKGAVTSFIRWYQQTGQADAYRGVLAWKAYMRDDLGLAAATINAKLSAVRRYFATAASLNLIDARMATAIQGIGNVASEGKRLATWLSKEKATELLNLPDVETPIGSRDYAILSLLVGVALRRGELISLTWGQFEKVEDSGGVFWIIRDLRRKRNRTQSIPVPGWTIDALLHYASFLPEEKKTFNGRVFLSYVNNEWGNSISEKAIYNIVSQYGEKLGVPELAPHDLRRTWAALAYKGNADLLAIQETLGHSNIETTRRYLAELSVFENDSVYKTGLDNPNRSLYNDS